MTDDLWQWGEKISEKAKTLQETRAGREDIWELVAGAEHAGPADGLSADGVLRMFKNLLRETWFAGAVIIISVSCEKRGGSTSCLPFLTSQLLFLWGDLRSAGVGMAGRPRMLRGRCQDAGHPEDKREVLFGHESSGGLPGLVVPEG